MTTTFKKLESQGAKFYYTKDQNKKTDFPRSIMLRNREQWLLSKIVGDDAHYIQIK